MATASTTGVAGMVAVEMEEATEEGKGLEVAAKAAAVTAVAGMVVAMRLESPSATPWAAQLGWP